MIDTNVTVEANSSGMLLEEEKHEDETMPDQKPVIAAEEHFVAQSPISVAVDVKVASGMNEAARTITRVDPVELEYRVEEYISADEICQQELKNAERFVLSN